MKAVEVVDEGRLAVGVCVGVMGGWRRGGC